MRKYIARSKCDSLRVGGPNTPLTRFLKNNKSKPQRHVTFEMESFFGYVWGHAVVLPSEGKRMPTILEAWQGFFFEKKKNIFYLNNIFYF
jgi:hypothetical protein